MELDGLARVVLRASCAVYVLAYYGMNQFLFLVACYAPIVAEAYYKLVELRISGVIIRGWDGSGVCVA